MRRHSEWCGQTERAEHRADAGERTESEGTGSRLGVQEEAASYGAGLVDKDTSMEAMQHKIIKWMPQSCTFTLEGHTDGVTCLAHSIQHKKLLSGSLDRSIKVPLSICVRACAAAATARQRSSAGLDVCCHQV